MSLGQEKFFQSIVNSYGRYNVSGYSLKYTQLVQNGNFEDSSYWTNINTSNFIVSNNIAKFTAIERGGRIQSWCTLKKNHINLWIATIKTSTPTNQVGLLYYTGSSSDAVLTNATTEWQTVTAFSSSDDDIRVSFPRIQDYRDSNFDEIQIKNVRVFDLTADFGAGNEPTTVEECEAYYGTDYLPYTTSTTIMNATSPFRFYDENNVLKKTFTPSTPLVLRSANGVNETSHNLPAEYQEVEYIESTGTQWIDTEVKPTNKTKVEIEFKRKSEQAEFVFGSRTSYTANDLFDYYSGNGNAVYAQFGNSNSEDYIIDGNIGRHIVNISQNGFYFDNSKKREYQSMIFESTLNMYLFGLNGNNHLNSETFKGEINKCKIYNNSTLIRNFIPCYRKSDNVIGMYDLVNGVFYTNQGTGTFLKGKDIVVDNWRNYTGKTIRNVGEVDLGSLSYQFNSSGRIYTTISNAKPQGLLNGLMSKYKFSVNAYYQTEDKTWYGYNGTLYIYDTNYITPSALKTSLQGVKLQYELATPTTETNESILLPKHITKVVDSNNRELKFTEI